VAHLAKEDIVMIRVQGCRGPLVALAVAAILVASPAIGAQRGAVAELRAGGASLDWSPLVGHESMKLVVSGPGGFIFEREFGGAEAPSLSIFDKAGQRLPDGQYTWELRVTPQVGPAVKRQLAAARRSGDEGAIEKLRQQGLLPQGGVQSGSFRIAAGAFVVDEGATEPRPATAVATAKARVTAADVVTADDAIIQGSACIGLDCVNNESFGFDTIRLKENNTRIKFDDTSTSAGFPANDWQLTANDSASGGSSKFSIEDITGSKVPFTITAGASTNSIFVDSTGRVGLRTSTPVLDLHINTSNTPAIRLEQNNSGGFTAQTWDIAGNEANFFVRDVTGGSRLPFRIRPGAPTSSVDIAADGDVGIGTASPSSALHVSRSDGSAKLSVTETSGTGASRVLFALSNNGQVQFTMKDTAQTPNWQFTASNAFQIDNTAHTGVELQVDPDGTLRVNGTAMTVPDFVFEPGYSLMPLQDLATFVATNRHLPDVPNAQQIKTEGLNLSAFPLQMLQKVEELTLYTIQQDEHIAQLQSDNAKLEARLRALEEKLAAPAPEPH
jgi:hypothetical protein